MLTTSDLPNVAFSSDFITGFCGETEADHQQTLDLLRQASAPRWRTSSLIADVNQQVQYEHAFMFAYSLREKTYAHRHYEDDVPEQVSSGPSVCVVRLIYSPSGQAAASGGDDHNLPRPGHPEGLNKEKKNCKTIPVIYLSPSIDIKCRAKRSSGLRRWCWLKAAPSGGRTRICSGGPTRIAWSVDLLRCHTWG